MSLKYEQYRALHITREFLREILWDDNYPEEMRDKARRCLRHFPFLDQRGAPLFSMDEFECPVLDDED